MCRWRYETQRHLPRFAVHWQLALAEIGHINCPMMECNYISLSEADMFNHYLHCDGVSFHVHKGSSKEVYSMCLSVFSWFGDWSGVFWGQGRNLFGIISVFYIILILYYLIYCLFIIGSLWDFIIGLG